MHYAYIPFPLIVNKKSYKLITSYFIKGIKIKMRLTNKLNYKRN